VVADFDEFLRRHGRVLARRLASVPRPPHDEAERREGLNWRQIISMVAGLAESGAPLLGELTRGPA
jgi:hypothetical protein